MKKHLLTIILIFLGLLNLSMYSGEGSQLLHDQDLLLLENSNSRGPALRALIGKEPYWESYSEWLCFSTESLDLRISEHQLEKLMLVPTLAVWSEGHLYEFEVSTSIIGESGTTVYYEWEGLLKNEDFFCVMAAFLQNLGSQDRSLWILQSFKTSKGYWHKSELEYLNDNSH